MAALKVFGKVEVKDDMMASELGEWMAENLVVNSVDEEVGAMVERMGQERAEMKADRSVVKSVVSKAVMKALLMVETKDASKVGESVGLMASTLVDQKASQTVDWKGDSQDALKASTRAAASDETWVAPMDYR